MVIGSDSRQGLGKQYGSGLVTDQSDTLMIIHIPANRQWAEVMSIPRDSWVDIPACQIGNGQMSSPAQFKINEAFATGNLDGNQDRHGIPDRPSRPPRPGNQASRPRTREMHRPTHGGTERKRPA